MTEPESAAEPAAATADAAFDEFGADYDPFTFTVSAKVLGALCQDAARVVPTTDFQPVLKGIKVQVGPGEIRLAATDLDLAVVAASAAVSADKVADVVLPARRLLDILAAVDSGAMAFAIAGDRADITAGTATWSLRLADGSDYPELPDVGALWEAGKMLPVPGQALLTALGLVRHALGREGSRPGLQQAVIAAAKEGHKLTACDGARLAQVPVDFPFPAAIPRGAAEELVRLLEHFPDQGIRAGQAEDGQLVFQLGDTVFTTQPSPSKFPDVEKLLLAPALSSSQKLEVSRSLLAEAIRAVRVTADPQTNAIALQLSESKCEVVSRDRGGNRASQVVPAKWTGPARTIVASHRHLSDLLEVVGSESVAIQLGTDTAKRKSPLYVVDSATGLSAVVSQMLGAMLGY